MFIFKVIHRIAQKTTFFINFSSGVYSEINTPSNILNVSPLHISKQKNDLPNGLFDS